MGNIEENDGYGVTFIGRTYRNDDQTTSLMIPTDLAKDLQIENSKVSISIIDGLDGNRHLLVSKYCSEILIYQNEI